MKREPRLQFSDADLAEPKLEKPIKRVKKAAAKADKAQAKIPKKTVVKKERGFDPATGKVKTQLRFEEVDKKKPPSKLTHAMRDAPANFVLSQVHREVRQSEDDNVGVEAAHKVEQAVDEIPSIFFVSSANLMSYSYPAARGFRIMTAKNTPIHAKKLTSWILKYTPHLF